MERKVEFSPFSKRDVGILHEDGLYLDSVPKKIGGVEKVGQMCAIILINRLRLEQELRSLSNYDLIPLVVSQLVEATKELFDNSGEQEDENLDDLVVEDLTLIPSSKELQIRLGVFTKAGAYASLHLRLPVFSSTGKLSVVLK